MGADAVRGDEDREWLGDLGYFDSEGYLAIADSSVNRILAGGVQTCTRPK